MAMAAANPLTPSFLSPQTLTYQPMLQESVHHFLSQLKSGISDFSHFNLIFSRLIQTMPSPPLEVIWFYSAVNFHTQKNMIAEDDKLGMVFALKELFQFLVSCSASCSSSLKRIAVLAPLVFEVHSLVCEVKLDNVGIKREIECLVDGLVSYISLCCCEGVDDHDDSIAISPCFVDLVKVWTVPRRGSDLGFEDDVRMLFPIMSEEVRARVFVGTIGVDVLAGMVMCQAFLLNMCLKFWTEELPKKLNEDVLNTAINTITGFRSCYFFDTLLKVMLDSCLPIASLLNCFDEVKLREVLFDAVILVDYPFFNPECGVRLCSHHLNSLASVWLFVAEKALKIVGKNGDQTKVIMYRKAFSKSLIHTQLLRWVSNQIGMVNDENKPNLSTPAAFIEWLVQLRSQASSGFDTEFSMLLERAMHHIHKSESPLSEADGDVRAQRDFEMTDITAVDAVVSTCDSNFAALNPCRKRKGANDEETIQAKLPKFHSHDGPIIKQLSHLQSDVGLIRRN